MWRKIWKILQKFLGIKQGLSLHSAVILLGQIPACMLPVTSKLGASLGLIYISFKNFSPNV
jgi:hypothetical protein